VYGKVTAAHNVFSAGVYGYIPFPSPGPPLPGSVNFAVYGDLGYACPLCLNPPCAPCPPVPPGTAPDFAGYFNGDGLFTSALYWLSDANLKQNIQDLENPMNIINALNPKTYAFNQDANISIRLSADTIHAGLLAQDVEGILPGAVKDCIHPARFDSLGNEIFAAINYKAINYVELIPYLIAGMKQQQIQIDSLLAIVSMNELPMEQNPDNNSGNSIDVILTSKTIVLNQNEPNPFKENTIIEYFIPDDSENVKIIFTDNKGSVLKEVDINEKGKGQLNVYASDLSSGIYTYTIVADGITIDTKRMMKTK
jgi:hypothetical protein